MIHKIIPTPKNVKELEGFTNAPLCISSCPAEWKKHSDALCESIEKLFDESVADGARGIELICDPEIAERAYRLDTCDGIRLSASDGEGIVYAIATLLQICAVKDGEITVKRALIEDQADKEYRALMVDLARRWHPLSSVLKYVDLCFILKIKYLHLHFCDTVAFTLPSRSFPKLNTQRSYSYADIAKLNERAAARGVIIVPEIEMPGHASIVNRNYKEIFANDLISECESIVSDAGDLITATSIICAGKPSAMEGVKTLISEVCELFPDTPYIHLGGDEANIKAWDKCRHCKKYMSDNGIEDVYELYSEFIGRATRLVLDMGKIPIVWEGFPKKGAHHVPKETIVIAWESLYNLPNDLLDEGFKIINASWKPLYVVPQPTRRWGVPEILAWNVYNWQNWWRRSHAMLNPITVQPTDRVIGGQLSVWEGTFEHSIGRAMENLAALSERTWNVERLWDDDEFLERLEKTIMRIANLIKDE